MRIGVGIEGKQQRFSALQRAEIAEMVVVAVAVAKDNGFSALQRAEIAEINDAPASVR